MISDMMPGTEEQLNKELTSAYVGIDPTADSLHIGHLVSVMMLKHLQVAGHRPIVVLGGATGMIGDPSGKSQERNLLNEETLRANEAGIKKQLSKFLDFESEAKNSAVLVNNYDWMKDFSFLEFIRDIGKHITVNYMMAKDSVKRRLDGTFKSGLTFTEFTYQLVQGTDFLHLYNEYGCKLQMGGSDQWGNIVTGTELIRRKVQGEAFAVTCPLITKADGGKFGKTESGNIWLDPERTSPYKFYQFWLNSSDADAEKYIKIFTLIGQEEVETLVKEHAEEPHLRKLQKRLAEEVTIMVHGQDALDSAVKASQMLFGKATKEELETIDEKTFLDIFEGVPTFELSKELFASEIDIVDFVAEHTQVFPSKGEARRMVKGNGLAINKAKVALDYKVAEKDLIGGKYVIAQKGKKNYFLVIVK
jgi:tyrosyl-tRNA synthetase